MENIGILKQALPYIRQYKGKTFVVKIGGELVQDLAVLDDMAQDISLLHQIGIRIILIHGGGPQATELARKLGIAPRIIEGRRVTDEETLEVTKMVFAGKINHEILTVLRKHGAMSVGLSGIDGDVVIARRREPVEVVDRETGARDNVDFGHVGDIVSINEQLLRVLLDNGYIPVISSLADDGQGNILNINADTVASRIAVAVQAYKYITMTNVGGILTDLDDPSTRISYISQKQARELIENGTIRGGMVPKIRECIHAVENGVKRVHILDGTVADSLLIEVFTRTGNGTMI
ncbi:MAG: acetylglutamate kinase, partial [Spirochaetota bacterium]